MSKLTARQWARGIAKTAIQAFAGAIVVGLGGGEAAAAAGHPIHWQAQLIIAATAAMVAIAAYLQNRPLWGDEAPEPPKDMR